MQLDLRLASVGKDDPAAAEFAGVRRAGRPGPRDAFGNQPMTGCRLVIIERRWS